MSAPILYFPIGIEVGIVRIKESLWSNNSIYEGYTNIKLDSKLAYHSFNFVPSLFSIINYSYDRKLGKETYLFYQNCNDDMKILVFFAPGLTDLKYVDERDVD